MTINPLTQASTKIYTVAIELNANNPAKLAKFYEEMIGLTLLEANETEGQYTLGAADGVELIKLYQATTEKTQKTTGLYHLALLLPTRGDLGEILRHLVVKQVALEGASDHGYSEALYLSDPEGNGIEIYADKDTSQWDKHDNGLIGGIVEPMDTEGVLAEAKKEFNGIPLGTTMGHIHLHVDDLEETMQFYHEVLGLGLKFIMGQSAIFMATQDYHHHLGANLWQGQHIPAAQDGTQGLRTSVWAGSTEDLASIEENFQAKDYNYEKVDDKLTFKDPAGTNVHILLNK